MVSLFKNGRIWNDAPSLLNFFLPAWYYPCRNACLSWKKTNNNDNCPDVSNILKKIIRNWFKIVPIIRVRYTRKKIWKLLLKWAKYLGPSSKACILQLPAWKNSTKFRKKKRQFTGHHLIMQVKDKYFRQKKQDKNITMQNRTHNENLTKVEWKKIFLL